MLSLSLFLCLSVSLSYGPCLPIVNFFYFWAHIQIWTVLVLSCAFITINITVVAMGWRVSSSAVIGIQWINPWFWFFFKSMKKCAKEGCTFLLTAGSCDGQISRMTNYTEMLSCSFSFYLVSEDVCALLPSSLLLSLINPWLGPV